MTCSVPASLMLKRIPCPRMLELVLMDCSMDWCCGIHYFQVLTRSADFQNIWWKQKTSFKNKLSLTLYILFFSSLTYTTVGSNIVPTVWFSCQHLISDYQTWLEKERLCSSPKEVHATIFQRQVWPCKYFCFYSAFYSLNHCKISSIHSLYSFRVELTTLRKEVCLYCLSRKSQCIDVSVSQINTLQSQLPSNQFWKGYWYQHQIKNSWTVDF